ncbi:diacylglycerol kinase family protein [Alkalihalobacillus sp. AL-G]|uniref:diacylglycerol/lipid kinase family protein n=1 Tax=Alkalihalobacillus sp. AL-G TaxID=2926399 RepID=UPI00272BCDFE|nr:YegS/Rv2252/BmrU family lipid kinase [Alkalihalobacillus sp. AL-G]WLD93874.1 YegS/Rv2252/BmrU family lipid kinase [Alkalihalobacillus sp. AL-G]
MKTNKKAIVIYNPGAGKRRKHRHVPAMIGNLANLGFDITTYHIKNFAQLEEPVTMACRHNVHSIFIFGGDGTVNRCIQCISKESYRPKIGIIPLGTSNEFAKYLGMPTKLVDVLPIIHRQNIKSIDIGKIGNHYFANIAAAGWLTDITYKTSPILKSWLGELAYCLSFFKSFLFTKQTNVITITLPQKKILCELSLFLIMNGNSVGPFDRLIDCMNRDDGHFHLITLQKTNKFSLFFTLLLKMLHLPDRRTIFEYQAIRSIDISFTDLLPFNLDGEQAHINSLNFEVLQGHLNVYTLK